jgi:eukaryotic-like serine/threonine-protein kinase
MNEAPVKPGDTLAGKYRVERVLGNGAMGVVVAARHVDLDRLVALKFIISQRGGAEEQAARFLREAQAASKLKSEHVGRVMDVGKLEDGAPYIVMELLEGKDLERLLQERGALSVADALTYVLQAAHAVAEAHANGIVHRDLKPANLFLTLGPSDEPLVKVLDFGISKLDRQEANLTRTGEILGSPLYMSPEQISSSRDVDGRSDVWSLGVILYELLAGPGVTPFQAKTLYAILARIGNDAPTPLETYRPDLPPGLVAVVTQCFEKRPARRYATVSALVAALAPYVPPSAASYVKQIAIIQGDDAVAARPTIEFAASDAIAQDPPPAPATTAPSGGAPATLQGAVGTIPGLERGRLLWLAVAVLLGVGSIAGLVLAMRSAPPQPPSGTPAGATTAPAVASLAPLASSAAVEPRPPPVGSVSGPTAEPAAAASPSGAATPAPGPSGTASAHHVARAPGHPAIQTTAGPRTTTYDKRD